MKLTIGEALHAFSLRAELGEGPVWDSARSLLWCVDILAPAIHALDPATGERRNWPAPAKIGWVLPAAGDYLVAGLADGLYAFTPNDGAFRPIVTVEPDRPGNRLNDATLGSDGAIWFGTMDDAEKVASGRFYRFDGRLSDCGIAPMTITNGPALSPDGATFYAVDTLAGEIRAYPVRGVELGKGRIFARIAPADGYPDGICCDAEGGLWVGLWGGWCARRYDARGMQTDEVRFPAAHVTKVALGGREGRTAYATTARKGLDAAALTAQPLAGDIFRFDVEVGAPSPGVFSGATA
ncbi:MAG: SMP-30/gluconolactonase/LRE family protein [Rhizorhabdus sp.]